MWGFFIALAIGVLVSDNTWCAISAISISAFIVSQRREDGPWGSSFKWSIVAAIYLLFIRLFTSITISIPVPGHTLFTIPQLTLPSWLPGIRIGGPVTSERVISSLHEALIIATIIITFGAANSVTSPHKLLRTLPAFIYQLSVALTIATSILPQFVSSISRIRQAQLLRNGHKPRISSIAIPLLEESLSRSIHLAESMESRGYGKSRKRSRYRPFTFTGKDFIYLFGAIAVSTSMVVFS